MPVPLGSGRSNPRRSSRRSCELRRQGAQSSDMLIDGRFAHGMLGANQPSIDMLDAIFACGRWRRWRRGLPSRRLAVLCNTAGRSIPLVLYVCWTRGRRRDMGKLFGGWARRCGRVHVGAASVDLTVQLNVGSARGGWGEDTRGTSCMRGAVDRDLYWRARGRHVHPRACLSCLLHTLRTEFVHFM